MHKAIRVLVANRPKLMRETVLAVLSDQPWIEVVGEVSSDIDIPSKVHELSPEVLVIAVDEPGKRPTLCDTLLRELPSLHIIAVAPQQNFTVCYWATLDIRSDDFESSEEGFLNAVRRVAQASGVHCEPRSTAGSATP